MLRKLMVLTLVMFIAIRGATGQSCSADIVFVVDESSSISSSWFDLAKQFMSDFLDCFVDIHDIWVGVIPYHCVPRTYFSLSQPSDPSIFDGLLKAGGLSRIGLAIRYTQATTMDDYTAQADAARAAGIQLYAVSVGDFVDSAALDSIAGGSDHVFSSNNPCNLADRVLADLCNITGCPDDSPMVYCFADPCTVATCPATPDATCVSDYCGGCNANFFDTDGGQAFPDGCVHEDGSLIPVGDTYELDDCTNCTCLAPGEEPQCESMACIALHCANPVKIVGQCCPVCVGCLYGDVLIPVDGTYEPDPCTSCTCDTLGGEPQCVVMDCPPLICNNAVYVPGYCCPVCPGFGCPHEDGLILTGTAYQPDPCTNCTCPIGGMAPMCEETICPFNMYTLCPHAPGFPPALPVPVAGQCCGDCDAPPGCWYKEDNILIPMGTDYKPNPCMIASCFFPGFDPAIAIMDCAPPDPDCPGYVHIAGECCPRCQTDL
uniref:VWFA domain-containing protein n=1 Tax=Branchiostoma floridae TaxID=7739 RepID=C3YGY2_BRAFL|eukprot:XP_002604442.1 hypothetical protein BRAFLDRAFT_122288 [Branchiostoma floridae]